MHQAADAASDGSGKLECMADGHPNRSHCPGCGDDNACGIERGASTCWCFSSDVSRDAIDALPEAQRGEACLCSACAANARNPKRVAHLIESLLRQRR